MSCPEVSGRQGQRFSTNHPPAAHTSLGNTTGSSPSLLKNTSWGSSPRGDAGASCSLPKYRRLWSTRWKQGSEHITSISAALKLLTVRNAAPTVGSASPSSVHSGWAWDLFACSAACSLMTICPAVPTPLLRVGGRLLNQAFASEHHTRLTRLCLYPCASVAGGCCRSPGPAHGHPAMCVTSGVLQRTDPSGVGARPAGTDAARR